MDKFTNLLAIEGEIAMIYRDLSNVEANVTMDNIEDSYQLFIALINRLLELLTDEENLLISLSKEELDFINMLLKMGTISAQNEDMFVKEVKDRIDFRINGNNPNLDNNYDAVVLNYILDDFDNYYLSFIEEWIHNERNKLTKEYLISKKYQYLFLISRRLERRKIKESFATEDSVYTESYMMSQLYNFSREEYLEYKKRVAVARITSSIERMANLLSMYDANDNKEPFEIIYKLFGYDLRSGLMLLSEEEREEVIQSIQEEDDSFEEAIGTIFNKDFNMMIEKDTERHKLLSLNL